MTEVDQMLWHGHFKNKQLKGCMDSEFPKESCVFLQKVTPKWATSACYGKSWNPAVICVDGNLGVDEILMLTIRCADRNLGRSVHRSPPFSHRWPAEFDWPLLVHFRPAPPQVWEIVGTKQRSMSHKKNRYETNLPETSIAPCKWMVGRWNFLLRWPVFRCYVSFREGNLMMPII